MSVTIKSAREIELMREAGRILAKVHEELEKATGQKRVRLLKRLECVDAFRLSGQRP